jgi:hypothetical protein
MRKITLMALASLALATGCTYTHADLTKGTVRRISVLQKTDVPNVTATGTNGVVVSMVGYSNDGGGPGVEMAAKAFGTAAADVLNAYAGRSSQPGFTQSDVDALLEVAIARALKAYASGPNGTASSAK